MHLKQLEQDEAESIHQFLNHNKFLKAKVHDPKEFKKERYKITEI